eukprot:jgi/Mesen1/4114/ME000216S03372
MATLQPRRGVATFYDLTVERFAAKPIRTVTLRQMLAFGETAQRDGGDGGARSVVQSARFVHRELPVRLARRLLDLQALPYIVVTNPHIKRVYDAYRRAFDLLRAFPPVASLEDNQAFTELLLLDEQAPLLSVIAKGVKECSSRTLIGRELALDPFLDNMLRSRISRRVLAEQHISLQQKRRGYIDVVERAIEQCEGVCSQTYGVVPRYVVSGDTDTSLAYIPAHIDYMLFEVLKNASRAVVEHTARLARRQRRPLFAGDAGGSMPPIVIQICKGHQEVTIKISDQGGGIDEAHLQKVWKYGYSTVDEANDEALRDDGDDEDEELVEEGRHGYGSDKKREVEQDVEASAVGAAGAARAARGRRGREGGGSTMVSMPGYGTDVYLRIHRLGTQAEAIEI